MLRLIRDAAHNRSLWDRRASSRDAGGVPSTCTERLSDFNDSVYGSASEHIGSHQRGDGIGGEGALVHDCDRNLRLHCHVLQFLKIGDLKLLHMSDGEFCIDVMYWYRKVHFCFSSFLYRF